MTCDASHSRCDCLPMAARPPAGEGQCVAIFWDWLCAPFRPHALSPHCRRPRPVSRPLLSSPTTFAVARLRRPWPRRAALDQRALCVPRGSLTPHPAPLPLDAGAGRSSKSTVSEAARTTRRPPSTARSRRSMCASPPACLVDPSILMSPALCPTCARPTPRSLTIARLCACVCACARPALWLADLVCQRVDHGLAPHEAAACPSDWSRHEAVP